jgi:hypothetical protein
MAMKRLSEILQSNEIFPIKDAIDDWEKKSIEDNPNLDIYEVITGGGVGVDVIEPPRPTYGVDQEGGGRGSGRGGRGGSGGRRYKNKEILDEIIAKLNLQFTKKSSRYTEIEEQPWLSSLPSGSIALLPSYIETQKYAKLQLRKGKKLIIDPLRAIYTDTIEEVVPSSAAVFMIIRDVSGSMGITSKTAYTVAYMVDLALKKKYNNRVEHVYVAHTEEAWEEHDAESFFKLAEFGGTEFTPAYNYATRRLYPLKSNYDLYVMHITDGENFDTEQFKSAADNLLSIIDRMFYVEIQEGNYSKETVPMSYFKDRNKVRAIRIPNSTKAGDIISALEKLFA